MSARRRGGWCDEMRLRLGGRFLEIAWSALCRRSMKTPDRRTLGRVSPGSLPAPRDRSESRSVPKRSETQVRTRPREFDGQGRIRKACAVTLHCLNHEAFVVDAARNHCFLC
jgi:hypothetical protein